MSKYPKDTGIAASTLSRVGVRLWRLLPGIFQEHRLGPRGREAAQPTEHRPQAQKELNDLRLWLKKRSEG